jgi:HK97 family phage prohead protease
MEFEKLEEKTFPFEIKSISEEGEFEGYAAIFGGKPDLYNEIIEPGAFKKTLSEKSQFPVLWYHDPRNPLGVADAATDKKGLHVLGQLNLEVQLAKEKRALMVQKAIRGLSIGFRTITDTIKNRVRYLKEIKLYEITLCTFQVHPKALVKNVKALGFDSHLDSLKVVEEFLVEVKAGRMISSVNMKLINNAVQALVALIAKAEPSKDTQNEGAKSIYSSVIEGLETENKPQVHLFGSTIKTLENTKKE